MTYFKLNGTSWDVDVAIGEITENFNVLDGGNAGRTLAGDMVRDIIGTYIGHAITLFNGRDNGQFDALWDYLIAHSVDDSVLLEAADGQTSIAYEAYYTSGSRKLAENRASGGVNR